MCHLVWFILKTPMYLTYLNPSVSSSVPLQFFLHSPFCCGFVCFISSIPFHYVSWRSFCWLIPWWIFLSDICVCFLLLILILDETTLTYFSGWLEKNNQSYHLREKNKYCFWVYPIIRKWGWHGSRYQEVWDCIFEMSWNENGPNLPCSNQIRGELLSFSVPGKDSLCIIILLGWDGSWSSWPVTAPGSCVCDDPSPEASSGMVILVHLNL